MVHQKSAHGGARRCQYAGPQTSIMNGCRIKKSSIMQRVAICGRWSFLPYQLLAIDWVISISYLLTIILIYKHFIIENTKQWRCRRWSL
ncbi:hypothetical protein IMY05_001G0120000 [Salix suchowensis]|nr:hypothetical protein IMY05_001G0120000 [Salix suchowensis]